MVLRKTLTASGRLAFTLIEMLVVISMIVVLATLAVAVIPRVQQQTKASRGAQLTQGWLLVARERALRDHAPRGVRLIIDPTDNLIRSMVYIEQPEPFTGGQLSFDPNNPNHAAVSGADLTGGFGQSSSLWPVQVGDYLQFQNGQSYLITGINTPNPGDIYTQSQMWVPNPNVNPQMPGPTSNYVIIRSARPTAGEETLRLPDDVVIDPNLCLNLGGPSALLTYDLLFSPSGAMTGTIGNANGKIALWLRDTTKDYPLVNGPPLLPNTQGDTGDQPLLVIYSRTGRIGAAPFNRDPNIPAAGNYNPYYWIYDPRNSGL